MDSGGAMLVVLAVLAGLLIVMVALSVRIVPQWANMVVYRWGQTGQTLVRTAGLRFLIPVADKGFIVDLR